MVIEDTRRGMEFHFDLTKDNRIRKVEIIFAEPKDFSCILRPEGLFAACGSMMRMPSPVPQPVPTQSRQIPPQNPFNAKQIDKEEK